MSTGVFPRPSRRVVDPVTGKVTREPIPGKSAWAYGFGIGRGDQRRNITKSGFRTKREAEKARATALAEHLKGQRVEPSKLTTGAFLTDWIAGTSHSLKPSTGRGYEAIIRTKVSPKIGAIRLDELTGVDIARAWGELRTDGRRDGKGGLSETTILQCHAVVHKALNHAVRARLISRNVAGDLDRPKITKTEMRTWSTDQVRQFLAETAGERLNVVWEVAVRTGMRRGELLGLQWADIDLKRGTLVVRRNRVAAGGTVTEGSPKSGRARTITVAPTVVAALEVWQHRQREERMVWSTDGAFAQGYVLTREDGTPANPASISQAFDRRVARCELPRLRFHDLRHTCASLMLESGVDLVTVSRHLGHGSIAITADTYGHVSPAMASDAVLRLDAHIAGA